MSKQQSLLKWRRPRPLPSRVIIRICRETWARGDDVSVERLARVAHRGTGQVGLIVRTIKEEWDLAHKGKPVFTGLDAKAGVYLLQRVSGGPVKIGYTKRRAGDRRVAVEKQKRAPMRVLAVIEGEGRATESALHKLFSAHRITGEWFAPSRAIFEHFKVETVNTDTGAT